MRGVSCSEASVVNDSSGPADASDEHPESITTIMWPVTDSYGNETTCVQTVNVSDDQAPEITCPADQNEVFDAACALVLPDYISLASATDNSDPVLVITQSPAPGTVVTGDTVVTMSTTDSAGNTTTCTFTVFITDDEVPTITCAANQTQTADAGNCSAAVTVVAPVTADNCSVASVVNDYNGTADATDTYPVGTTTVVWTVTDNAGNTATCSQDITVTDDEAPSITCAANQTQTADAGNCDAAVTVVAPATADNWAVDNQSLITI